MMRSLLSLFLLLVLPCCAVGSANVDTAGLSGQPSWFPLGREVYRASDRMAAQAEPMGLVPQSRWFLSLPRAVIKAEYDAWATQQKGVQQEVFKDGAYMIPAELPYPKDLASLPLKDQGATLDLVVANSQAPEELVLRLTLKSKERGIYREVEHRWTNITPFLFALYADGEAITRIETGFYKMGGASQFIDVVEACGENTWTLRLTTESLNTLVGPEAKEVAIIAAFSERQHEAYLPGSQLRSTLLHGLPPQILIRSNVARILRDSAGWSAQ